MDVLRNIFAEGSSIFELIIYFIAVVLWVLAQVFAKAKQKKARRSPSGSSGPEPRPEGPGPVMRELLESLELEEEDLDPVFERPEPPSRRQSPQPPSLRVLEKPGPAIEPIMKPRLADIVVAPKMEAAAQSPQAIFSGGMQSIQFNMTMDTLTFPSMRNSLSFSGRSSKNPVVSSTDISKRHALRKGMAMRVILGPPKALETTPWAD